MVMKRPFFFLSLSFVLIACSAPRKNSVAPLQNNIAVDGKIWSSLFQQRAAEYKALCLQAYNIARVRIDHSATTPTGKLKAVITDIDETFLDNSPYAVKMAMLGKEYDPVTWSEWTAKGIADTLPGALSFFNYAASKQVEIFYITNREENERTGTLKNLQRFNFPFADDKHLLTKQSGSSKETRRMKLAADYDIILLLGDNLADFSQLFDKKSESQRTEAVFMLAPDFGNKFILLPNFNYGGWEEALYHNSYNWSAAQKDSIIKAAVKAYP
jgi:5'-nucleotidase (lipoprotein e(P4) family)